MKRKDFERCIKDKTLVESPIIEAGPKAKELLKLAQHREDFWKSIRHKANEYPSIFLEGHYEIIKELSTAILALDGWTSLDHECLFAYLKQKRKELDVDFDYLLDLKDVRNEISYRGLMVSYETWKSNALRISLTINALKEHLASRLKA